MISPLPRTHGPDTHGRPGDLTPISTATSKAGKAMTAGDYGAFPDNIAIIPNGKTAYVVITGDVFAAMGPDPE